MPIGDPSGVATEYLISPRLSYGSGLSIAEYDNFAYFCPCDSGSARDPLTKGAWPTVRRPIDRPYDRP